MKVILTQELKGRGVEGDVIDVARGFAVNYLFPRKMAIEATAGNVKQLEARRHNIEERELARRTDAESVALRLEGKSVVIGAKVGDAGRLYGSITAQMVEDAIMGQLDVDVDRRKLDVHGHIKTLGEHSVTVSVHRDVKAEVRVHVVPEEQLPGVSAGEAPPAEAARGEMRPESPTAQEDVADTDTSASAPALDELSLEEEVAAAVAEAVAEAEAKPEVEEHADAGEEAAEDSGHHGSKGD